MMAIGVALMLLTVPLLILGILAGRKHAGWVALAIAVTFIVGTVLVSNAVADRCRDKGGDSMTRGICFTEDGRRIR